MHVQIFSLLLLVGVALCATDLCHQDCTDDHQEICGSDGKTYVNSCKFGVASCKAHEVNRLLYELHSGFCSPLGVHSELPACTNICDEDIDSICGSDHKLYDNKCKFRKAQCEYSIQGKRLGMVSSSTSGCPIPRAINCTQYKLDVSGLAIELTNLNLVSCPHHSSHHRHYVCASNNRAYLDECQLCYHIEHIKSRNNGQALAANWMILHDGVCKRGISFNPFGINFVG